MGTDDDGVAALKGDHGILHGGDVGVGGRTDCAHHAYRSGHLNDALHLVLADNASALDTLQTPPDSLGLAHVLADLVLPAAHTGLLGGLLGQQLGMVIYDLADGAHALVHIFLRILLKFLLGHAGAVNEGLNQSLIIHMENLLCTQMML